MKIAILGTDADTVRLAAAAVSEGHDLIWLGDVRPDDERAIARLAPRLTDQAAEWELLLDGAVADGVLVGRGRTDSVLRAEQLKRLATEAAPLLVVHPATESVLTYYELDMIRRETGAVLRHYNPLTGHPILVELADWVREGHPAIGEIHQLTCERRVSSTGRMNVVHHLARDVELMAAAAGHIRRVSAIGPGSGAASFASLQVQMSCDGPASLRWAVGSPANFGSGLQLTLVGEGGAVSLWAPDDGPSGEDSDWLLDTTDRTEQDRQALPSYEAPRDAVQQLAAAANDTDAQRRARASTWDTATRAMEVLDAIELSLQKGRTIDVHQQQLTQTLAFRGTMAALGCGLLLVGLAVTVVVTLLGGVEGAAGQRLVPFWPVALLAVLAFFLLLQAVPLLAAKSKKSQPERMEATGDGRS